MDFGHWLLIWIAFLFVSVAASQLAVIFPKIKLPLITGYLILGIIAGPFVTKLLTKEDIPHLAPVNQFVLAFIGFSAGAELFLPELRELFKTIFLSVGAISILTFSLVTGVSRALITSGVANFIKNDDNGDDGTATEVKLSGGCVTGIAMIIASIMTARSPASAIAIAKELKAKGPFTRAFLGITVVSDVVVLLLFAIAVAFTRGQCTRDNKEGFGIDSIFTLIASLVLAVLLGYFVLGKLIVFLLWLKPVWKLHPKWLVLPIGYGIFRLNDLISNATLDHLDHEIGIEPLLMTIVAGYVATNQSKNRRLFLAMLQKVGPYVFIPFFTLTGASLDLSVLLRSALLAVIITTLRIFAIWLGSVIGGVLAKSPKIHTQYMWLSLITQAGVSLGLAGEVNFMFPDWGPACATAIVAVIMLNQIVGPILCKISIKKVGEHGKAKGDDEGEAGRSVLILGINGYSLALAERLRNSHWKVIMADPIESKLAYALKLNAVKNEKEDPHDQTTDAIAIEKKKKVYYHLDESTDEMPEPINNINTDSHDIALNNGTTTTTTTTTTSPPLRNSDNFNIIKKPPPPPAHHEEHGEEVIYDVQAKLLVEVDKANLEADEDIGITQWDYRDLFVSSGLDIKHDVVVCMLDTEAANILACTYFKDKLKCNRVIGGVLAPTSVDMYIKAGALPFYTFSSSVGMLYQYVTIKKVAIPPLVAMIQPEAENFPRNIELLPHLLPPELTHAEIEGIRAEHRTIEPVNLIDIDLDGSAPPTIDEPLAPAPHTPAQHLDRLRGLVVGGLVKTGQGLRELRDPIGLVNRGVSQMNVVPESQRDEYIDSIAALHDTRPITTNPIWMDLLQAPADTRRSTQEVFDDTHNPFQSDRSVFEEYHGLDRSRPPPRP